MPSRAAALVHELKLEPHPEGGWFRRVETSDRTVTHNGFERPEYTRIDYLLAGTDVNRWHRVDADETWQWLEGGSLRLRNFDAVSAKHLEIRLGPDFAHESRMYTVPAGVWQSAVAVGEYVLARCTVVPGFVWGGFELLAGDHPLAAILDGR